MLWRILNRLEGATAGLVAVRAFAIVWQPVAPDPLIRPNTGSGIDVSIVTAAEPTSILASRARAEIERRLTSGDQGFIAFDKGTYAGHLWLSNHDFDETEALCTFELPRVANIAWDYDLQIDPRYRMSRAFVRLWDAAFAHMRRHGIEASLSRISLANDQSLKSHRALRAREVGRTFFVRICGVWWYWGTFAADRRFSRKTPIRVKLTLPATEPAVK